VADAVRVVDGDTIDIAGRRVRFRGVDALEKDQVCVRPDGVQFLCGAAARGRLAELVAGATVVCAPDGTSTHDRVVADCEARREGGAPVALGATLVREGFAFDCPRYSGGRFAAAEASARRLSAGAWGTRVQYPWEHRGHPGLCRRTG
jgi:endonuclease YncB( thermonuclease family)